MANTEIACFRTLGLLAFAFILWVWFGVRYGLLSVCGVPVCGGGSAPTAYYLRRKTAYCLLPTAYCLLPFSQFRVVSKPLPLLSGAAPLGRRVLPYSRFLYFSAFTSFCKNACKSFKKLIFFRFGLVYDMVY
jgi:hypothetical protein